jgi:hypothetical protein
VSLGARAIGPFHVLAGDPGEVGGAEAIWRRRSVGQAAAARKPGMEDSFAKEWWGERVWTLLTACTQRRLVPRKPTIPGARLWRGAAPAGRLHPSREELAGPLGSPARPLVQRTARAGVALGGLGRLGVCAGTALPQGGRGQERRGAARALPECQRAAQARPQSVRPRKRRRDRRWVRAWQAPG